MTAAGAGTPTGTGTAAPSGASDVEALALEHLAELEEAQRPRRQDLQVPRHARVRRAGRRMRLGWTRVRVAIELLRRARSPRYAFGRRLAWLRLLRPRIDLPLLAAIGGLGLVVARYAFDVAISELVFIAYAGLIGIPAAGSLAYMWDEYFQCPFRAWRIRRRIRKRPACILPSMPASQAAAAKAEDPFEGGIIPRDDLYFEVLPGILRRHHRDVQVVVGEPGSGKTTALVGLAGLLARIGVVPVLVPLRGQPADEIVQMAEETFKRRLNPYVRSSSESDTLWRWLYRRKRIAVLTDDIDQLGPDGERGFVLRRTLDKLAGEDLPIVVTARPAGIPAGVAASSIELGELREDEVVAYVRRAAERDPGASSGLAIDDRAVAYWVREGRLTEAPFYLELLASLYAAGSTMELPEARVLQTEGGPPACFHTKPDGTCRWNPLWVRFRLLERYYAEVKRGSVRRWLGIEQHERVDSLRQLQDAALGLLRASGCDADAQAEQLAGRQHLALEAQPRRTRLEHFLDSDDRAERAQMRTKVSAHEVVDTGERLRLVDRDDTGELQFRHRIMQAYLAGRRLASYMQNPTEDHDKALRELLDQHHPEKLTVHMAVTFAALRRFDPGTPDLTLVKELVDGARAIVVPPTTEQGDQASEDVTYAAEGITTAGWPASPPEVITLRRSTPGVLTTAGNGADPVDPKRGVDPEERIDPDDALLKLTTAAEIAQATGATALNGAIVSLVGEVRGATRWTKLAAIASIAKLPQEKCWKRIWEFARDPDYKVRRAASVEIERNASAAYGALEEEIRELILHAAARSAQGLALDLSTHGDADWRRDDHALMLCALGSVLPAILSGLREESFLLAGLTAPSANGSGNGSSADGTADVQRRAEQVRAAREALDWLVALAFKGGRHDLEAAVAQGFKSDAMGHADEQGAWESGPGWVAGNRRLVAEICLSRAEFWYARMLLHQAIGLYAIAGSPREADFESFARSLNETREPHEFVRRAARLARRAVERKQVRSSLWSGLIWNDEGEVVGRRATGLDDDAAALVADVTLLLNLNERSAEDRQAQFGHMQQLPHCLAHSPDRREILGGGCPSKCGWGLCPYKQPPPDEPNTHRGVSRAFCRQQQQIAARRRRPRPWQRNIKRKALEDFWWELERRART